MSSVANERTREVILSLVLRAFYLRTVCRSYLVNKSVKSNVSGSADWLVPTENKVDDMSFIMSDMRNLEIESVYDMSFIMSDMRNLEIESNSAPLMPNTKFKAVPSNSEGGDLATAQ